MCSPASLRPHSTTWTSGGRSSSHLLPIRTSKSPFAERPHTEPQSGQTFRTGPLATRYWVRRGLLSPRRTATFRCFERLSTPKDNHTAVRSPLPSHRRHWRLTASPSHSRNSPTIRAIRVSEALPQSPQGDFVPCCLDFSRRHRRNPPTPASGEGIPRTIRGLGTLQYM